jgi:hypothetical protein
VSDEAVRREAIERVLAALAMDPDEVHIMDEGPGQHHWSAAMPDIVIGDPNDRSTWRTPEGVPFPHAGWGSYGAGVLVIPPVLARKPTIEPYEGVL